MLHQLDVFVRKIVPYGYFDASVREDLDFERLLSRNSLSLVHEKVVEQQQEIVEVPG